MAAISSARATNEENYLLQKLMRAVIGNNNVDNCSRLCHAPSAAGLVAAFGLSGGTNSLDDLDRTDCILLVGANPTEAHPVVGARLKQLVRQGARLVVIDPRRTELPPPMCTGQPSGLQRRGLPWAGSSPPPGMWMRRFSLNVYPASPSCAPRSTTTTPTECPHRRRPGRQTEACRDALRHCQATCHCLWTGSD